AVMFPEDPNRSAWERSAIKLAVNASSTAADASSSTVIDGQPLSSWIASTNLNDDLTMENHGFFNPIYQQVTHTNIDEAAIFYAQAGHPLPEAFSFRTQRIWDTILGRLADDNGDIVMPAGQDWISKDFQHLDYLSVLATRFGDVDASVLESRALQTVAARQATHDNGSILDQPQLGYESMLIKRLADSWWNHQLFGPSPTPTEAEFAASRAKTAGVTEFPSVDVIADRGPNASAYMSWDTERPMGLWIPSSAAHLDDPLFTYYAPGSLVGSATGMVSGYSCVCGKNQFSTAGVIGGRDFSMTTFPDGETLLLDRGTGSTFTYSVEQLPGLTGDRTVYSAAGAGLGALPGNWVDVAGRMSMIVLGGSGIAAADVHATNDSRLITGSTGTGTGNRGAVLVPNTDPQTTARLATLAAQPQVPDGWSALVARATDGTDRLAVARWNGPASTTLTIHDDRGAPVPAEAAVLNGSATTFSPALSAPASEGETVRFFVHTDGGALQAHQDGEDRAVLTNPGDRPVRASTTYVAADGSTSTLTRVIAPGETTVARVVNGRLTLAGAEYEHLLTAQSTLTGLQAEIGTWQADGDLGGSTAAQLRTTATQALDQIGRAVSAVTAQDPDTNRAAAAVQQAQGATARLAAPPDAPADVRDAITTAAQTTSAQLDAALGYLAVQISVTPRGNALPGESLTLHITLYNRGHGAADHGVLSLDAPDGWTMPRSATAFDSLPPGQTSSIDITGRVPADASPGAVTVGASLAYQAAQGSTTSATHVSVDVSPLYTITPASPSVPLAAGGWNEADFSIHNNAGHPLDLGLVADHDAGITATVNPAQVIVPAGGDASAAVELTDDGITAGTGTLDLTGTSATDVTVTASTQLRYSDNLAWNPTGSTCPAAFADSSQGAFPPALANDGNPGTFWVSGGPAVTNNGPTPTHPIALGVDLGHPVTVGSVTVTPRSGYGPKTYDVQVSGDDQSWTTTAQVVNGPNATLRTSFASVTARYVRILMTASYDRTDRNVQVAELEARPS
ncbi:MAG TPA: discoidin domain-containing protein, partial [Jatrophihabitans sp.]|nr:discoidin domain-containing protein [Jatrophihabitans sp.]